MALEFPIILIADEWYESADAFDISSNAVLNIVSGAYWNEEPDFVKIQSHVHVRPMPS
jgi:hypothetical protein